MIIIIIIMQGIWRQIYKPQSLQPLNNSNKSQTNYIDDLSRLIKIFKRKQQLYIKLLQNNTLQQKSDSQLFKNQHEKNLSEQSSLLATLIEYKQQSYSNSKTYLYSVFMRINEVIDHSRHKSAIYGPNQEKVYIEQKNKMLETYQNYTYFKNFDVINMIQLATKLQNERIGRFLPKKKSLFVRLPPALEITNKTHERIKSLQSTQIYKKTQNNILSTNTSIQIKQTTTLDILLAKKLQTSSKEIISKKKSKYININKLYKILQIKQINIQQFIDDRRQIQKDMIQRNQKIIQERKKWERLYQIFQNSTKNFRSKVIFTTQSGKQIGI